MSGIIGVHPAKSSGVIGAQDIRVGHSCAIKKTNSGAATGTSNYVFKQGGVTEILNMDASLFTADTSGDYGITVNHSGRYSAWLQIYYTSPTAVSYSEGTISVWNGSGYDTALPDSYSIHYREHAGSNKWKTVSSTAILFDGIAGKTYGLLVSVSSGTVQVNGAPTRLQLTYMGPS